MGQGHLRLSMGPLHLLFITRYRRSGGCLQSGPRHPVEDCCNHGSRPGSRILCLPSRLKKDIIMSLSPF